MAKYWGDPPFVTRNFFPEMTQNGLKWISNTTLTSLTRISVKLK